MTLPGLDAIDLWILVSAAIATSTLSAVVGMAGGLTLMAVMLLFFEPLLAVPLHGVVQLTSNTSRSLLQWRHIEWSVLARYALLLVPMSFIGLSVAERVDPGHARMLIGVFTLLATWAPGLMRLRKLSSPSKAHRRFVVLGGVVGFVQTTIGATGPLLAPFFLNLGLTRFGLIGTKAVCQMAGHTSKIAAFGFAGFPFEEHWKLLLLLALSVVAGSWIGTRILARVNEVWFVKIYKGVLTAIAIHLIVRDLV